jgi:hypothetical protein
LTTGHPDSEKTDEFSVDTLALRTRQFSDYASEAIRYAETGLQLCSLLKQDAVVLELGFELASLLVQHTKVSLRKGNDEWKQWEALFEFCLDRGTALGWVQYAPEIHRVRKEFFEATDRHTAATDVYNSYKAMKAAHFPSWVMMRYVDESRRFLNNHAQSKQEHSEAGELMELWANEFSLKEGSAGLRLVMTADFDQANALLFATQQYLYADDIDHSSELLRRAEEIINSTKTGDEALEHDRHECLTMLYYTKARYYGVRKLRKDEAECVRALWRERQQGEGSFAYLLLLEVEDQEQALATEWKNSWPEGALDPYNKLLSLPEEWQDGAAVIPCVLSKIDFRFAQLLTEMGITPSSRRRYRTELAQQAIQKDPDLPRTLLMFGRLSEKYQLSSEAAPYLLSALRAVLFYYTEVQPDLDSEIKTLQLLRRSEPTQWWTRLAEAQKTKAALLQRTAIVREPLEVFPTALRIHECLSMFIIPELEDRVVGSEAARLGKTSRELWELKRALSEKVTAATEAINAAKYKQVIDELSPLAPARDTLWVTVTDLWVVHNLILCARTGHIETDKEEEWAETLQSLAVTYVSQISRAISDKDAQRLAVDLLDLFSAKPTPERALAAHK